MNPKDELSPEEKLLRLIRHTDKKAPKEKKLSYEPTTSNEGKVSSLATPQDSKKNKFKKEFKFLPIKAINFVLINRLIFFLIFISLILSLFDLYLNQSKNYKFSPLSHQQKGLSLIEKEQKPFSYYQQEISKRNLFKLGAGRDQVSRTVPTSSTFSELIKNFSLLGIVSGKNPKVIIEDKKSNKTYFLFPGDLLGEIKIEEVYPDRVVLEFKGERISLFL